MRMKRFLLLAVLVVCLFGITGCGKKNVYLTFQVKGAEIKIDDTIQSIYDKGLVLCETDGTILQPEDLPKLESRIVDTNRYHIGIKGESGDVAECTSLAVCVYNDSMTTQSVAKCQIYLFSYNYPQSRDAESGFLVNGIDLKSLTRDEAIAKFEEMGMEFDAKQKEQFLTGENLSTLSYYTKAYKYAFESKPAYEELSAEDKENMTDEELLAYMENVYNNPTYVLSSLEYEKTMDVELVER